MNESRIHTGASASKSRIEQAETRTARAEARAARAESRTEQAKTRTEAAETRTEQAETRTDSAKTRTEQAETRTEQAETRAEQAETTLEKVVRHASKPKRRPHDTAPVTETASARQLEKLTERQREVLQHIAGGHNIKQIAGILKISPKTVEYHRMKLMNGLNVHDVPGLVRFAMKVGLVTPES